EAHASHGAKGLAVVGLVVAAFLGFTAFRLHLTPDGYRHYRIAMLAVGLVLALGLWLVAARMRRAPAESRPSEPASLRTYSIPVWFVGALAAGALLLLVGLVRELGGSVVPGGLLVVVALSVGAGGVALLKRARSAAGWPGLFTPPARS